MKQSHTLLLRLTKQKNHQAFKTLYDQTSPKIYSLILHFLRTKNVSEKVLEEVYEDIWHECGTYNSKNSSVISWMLDITKNKVASRLAAKNKSVLN